MAKNKVDLSIIILNFNTKDFLKDCLSSIADSKKDHLSFEIMVVDNASTDGSVEFIKELTSSLMIKLIENKKNLGFAAGNNLAIPRSRGRYLLFLNPDTKVLPDTFKTMLEFMDQHSRAGAATCRVELPNGQLDDACHRGFPTPINAFFHFLGLDKIFPRIKIFSGYSLGYLSLDKIHEIDSGVGAFLLVRRQAGDQVGWWDEDYFWYGEDLDFCYRLKEKGWKIYFVPQTKIVHYKGASSGIKRHSGKISTATKETKILAARSSTEVMRIFYQKHYRNRYPKLIDWLVMQGIGFLERIRQAKASF
jgi:GT2 family glycosyltransferase